MLNTNRKTYLNKHTIQSLEDNNQRQPSNKFNRTLYIICFIAFIAGFGFTSFIYLSEVLTQVFFQVTDKEYIANLQFTGLLALGFLARPVVAYFIGKFGDTHGRKPALVLALKLLLIATVVVTLLPTFSQIGIVAPILLILMRLLQGGAFGIVFVLTWLYIAENLPPSKLAFNLGLVIGSLILGAGVCALTAAFLTYILDAYQLALYGWRALFLISSILSLTGLVYAHQLNETALVVNHKARRGYVGKQQDEAYAALDRLNALLLTAVLSLIISSIIVIIVLIMPRLIALKFSINDEALVFANAVGVLFMVLGLVFYGWLVPRFSTSKMLRVGALLLAIQSFIFFYYLSHSGGSYIIPMYALLGFCSGIVGLCVVLVVRLFPISSRVVSIALIYNCMAIISGVFLPYILLYITNIISFSPALYVIFLCICIFIIGLHNSHPLNIDNLEEIDYRRY